MSGLSYCERSPFFGSHGLERKHVRRDAFLIFLSLTCSNNGNFANVLCC